MKLIIYTDGASRGNPGHSSYGFVITDASGKNVHKEGKYLGIKTNNFAEYSGVLAALKYIKEKITKHSELIFFMDSKLVVEQLSGRYKIKSENLRELIRSIKTAEIEFDDVSYTHIPREKNTVADSLANLALDSR